MGTLKLNKPVGDAPVILIDSGAGNSDTADQILFLKDNTEVLSIDVTGLLTIAGNGQKYRYIPVNIGDIAADSDSLVIPLLKPTYQITLYKVYVSVDTDIGDDNVNYQTIVLEDDSDNAIATLTSDIAWTAGTLQTMGDLDGTHKVITGGEVLRVDFTKEADGKAMSGCCFHLIYENTE